MVRLGLMVAAAALIAFPASAKVLTVCGAGPLMGEEQVVRPFASFAYAPGLFRASRIALTQDTAGYDLRLNWGEAGEKSLRAAGAEILANALDNTFVHLMVSRSETSPVEHYLFQLDAQGSGELLSGSGDEASDDALTHSTCVAP